MTWEVQMGPSHEPMFLQLVEPSKGRATFGPHPRKYRSRSFAESALKLARRIVGPGKVDTKLSLVESP